MSRETPDACALAHDALQVADAAAAAIAFAAIERHHYVAPFPDSFASRINSKADAIAERPHSNEAIQNSVRGRQAGSQYVGVVVDVNGSGDAAIAQRHPAPGPACERL